MNGRLHLTGFHQNSPASFIFFTELSNIFLDLINIEIVCRARSFLIFRFLWVHFCNFFNDG